MNRTHGYNDYNNNNNTRQNSNFDPDNRSTGRRLNRQPSVSSAITEFANLRVSTPTSDRSNSSEDLALLVNLDEIINSMESSESPSVLGRNAANPSRNGSPFSEIDPGTEIEVRFEDLSQYDIQGINWNSSIVSRDDYRDVRIQEYREFEANRNNNNDGGDTLSIPLTDNESRIEHTSPLGPLMKFRYMNKVDICTVQHFQLRHLLWCPTLRNVIFPHFSRIKSWNPITNQSEIMLNMADFGQTFSKASVIAANSTFLIVGGYSGEIVSKNISLEQSPVHLRTYSTEANSITNHIYPMTTTPQNILISCNDSLLRWMDLESGKIRQLFQFPYAVNASHASPDDRLVCCVGDSKKSRIFDLKSGKETAVLTGHSDYSFSCSWSPDGMLVATGNQDHSSRIYDLRNTSKTLHVLPATMAPVRNVTFSPDGALFAAMEADDFVHIYNVRNDFRDFQTIDFFGEIAGITFSPEGDELYIGCAGMEHGGIMEFNSTQLTSVCK